LRRGSRRVAWAAAALLVGLVAGAAWWLSSTRTVASPCARAQALVPADLCIDDAWHQWLTPSIVVTWVQPQGSRRLHDLDRPHDAAGRDAVAVVRAIGGPLVVERDGTDYAIRRPWGPVLATMPCAAGGDLSQAWWERWLVGSDAQSLAMVRFACANPGRLPPDVEKLVGPLEGSRSLAVCRRDERVACTLELRGQDAALDVHVLPTTGTPGDLWDQLMVRPGEAVLVYKRPGCVLDAPSAGIACIDASDEAKLQTTMAALAHAEAAGAPGYGRYWPPDRRQPKSQDGTLAVHYDSGRYTFVLECDRGRSVDLVRDAPACDDGIFCVFWAGENLGIQLVGAFVVLREAHLRQLCRA
jgi:hypothetical protein